MKFGKEIKKYLGETLGLELDIELLNKTEYDKLPLYIRQLFEVYRGQLLGRAIILLRMKDTGLATPAVLRKHVQVVEQLFHEPVVVVFSFLQAYNRKRMIQNQIAFIVPGRQIFIPQLLIDLKEYRQGVRVKREKLLPAAQCLLFFHLLKEDMESYPLKTVAAKLKYTRATVTRAVQALSDKELVKKTGKREIRIRFSLKKQELWERALPVLQNPVKKVYYPERLPAVADLYRAGYNALSYYTDLGKDNKICYAIAAKDFQTLRRNHRISMLPGDDGEICLQVWKYAPDILAGDKTVDPLSLYLTMRDERNERVEGELEKMIDRLW